LEELQTYIAEKLAGEHDYNAGIEAMADITLAAFNFAADQLGASGYSASCAELLFLAKSRRIDVPFGIMKGDDTLHSVVDRWHKLAAEVDK
jgi:hypothetical protein